MRPRGQRGIALIAVLWLIALLTLLAIGIVSVSLMHRRTSALYGNVVQAEAIADSALRIALLRLIARPEQALSPSATAESMNIFDTKVEITVEREAGRVDLNTADPELLFALFAANGWTESDAHSMVARILDWRDADDETSDGGAESREYHAAGLSYDPRNANFESVEEVRQVLGGDRINSSLLDAFTIFTHSAGTLDSLAVPAVKRALRWADERQLDGRHWLQEGVAIGQTGTPALVSLDGEVMRLEACALMGRETDRQCRRIIVRLTANGAQPLQVFDWRSVQRLEIER